MQPEDDWITVEVAADVIERSESWVYRAIRDHRLEARPGKNVQNMDIALVRRADVKRLSERHRGHMSPKAFIVSDSGSSSSSSSASATGSGSDTSSSSVDVISSRDDITYSEAATVAALTRLAGIQAHVNAALQGAVWAQSQEIDHLRKGVIDAERRAAAAEERVRALAGKRPWWRVWG